MRDLFDRLGNEGEAVLQEMLEANTAEGVDLEFKEKSELERPGFNKPDKQTLGRTLSAFANSAGGLLIFGAAARKNADGVDCLSELKPIPDIARLGTEASALLAQYLMPRHDGVRHLAVPSGRGDGSGYLAIHVERSDRRPHQSKAPDDGRYYKRAGDSTFAMEHYDIEDAFSRTHSPIISFVPGVASVRHTIGGNGFHMFISLGIRNDGLNLVRHPYIAILESNGPVYFDGLYVDPRPRWKFTADAPGQQLTGGMDDVVHAGTTQIGGFLMFSISVGADGTMHSGGKPIAEADYWANVSFGADGARPREAGFHFRFEDVAERLRGAGVI